VLIRSFFTKKTIKCWEKLEKLESLVPVSELCNGEVALENSVVAPRKTKTTDSIQSGNSTWGTTFLEIQSRISKDTHLPMFPVALLVITNGWKQSKWPWMDKCTIKMWHICNMQHVCVCILWNIIQPKKLKHASCSGGRDRRITEQNQPKQKNLTRPCLKKNKLGVMVHVWNPRYLGGRYRRPWSEARTPKNTRPYLKNKLKQKGLGTWLNQKSTCSSVRTWV
jgi:hypothetical protein